jgi:RNA polymerase sigma-70 factor (ECF subfamily)
LSKQNKTQRFNQVAMQHRDAAYNLAKWLTRNHQDAEDVVQESFIKAFRYLDSFQGEDGRAWLLTIVRHTSYTWLKAHNNGQQEEFGSDSSHEALSSSCSGLSLGQINPEQIALQRQDKEQINLAIQSLPVEFREVLVLREQEGFSYHEIASITGSPIGTVMSRLARARGLMRGLLVRHFTEG